ncbi:MAG: hypothetical protein DRJ60_00895 [Thermoprotei archaeon]|nr:MAG: hypothetical protein DRJ60_00895 [Thermoprotei archaeon]
MRYFLTKVEVEGFRGISKRRELELHPKLTILIGPNSSGKSSFIEAIEWGLVGDKVPREVYTKRRRTAIRNKYTRNTEVKIHYNDGQGRGFVIKAHLPRHREYMPEIDREGPLKGLVAAHIGFKDYIRSVVYAQADPRVIIEKAEHLNTAIDSILGLKAYKDFMKCIEECISKVERKEEALANELYKFKEELTRKYEGLIRKIEKIQSILKKYGIDPSQVSLKKIRDELKKLIPPDYKGDIPEDVEGLRRTIEEFKKLWEITPKLPTYQQALLCELEQEKKGLVNRKERLKSERTKCYEWLQQLESLIKDLSNIEEKLKGKNLEKLRSQLAEKEYQVRQIDNEIKKLNSMIEEMNEEYSIVEKAWNFLKKSKKAYCPVCNRELTTGFLRKRATLEIIEKRLESLKSEVEDLVERRDKLARELKDLNNERDQLEKQIEKIEQLQRERNKFRREIKNLLEEVSKSPRIARALENPSVARELLNETIRRIDEEICNIEKEIKRKEKQIEDLKRLIEESRARAEELSREKLRKMDIIYSELEYILLHKSVSRLEDLIEKEPWKLLEKFICKLEALRLMLIKLMNITKEVHESEAKEKLKEFNKILDDVYRALYEHPYFKHIEVRLKEIRSGTEPNRYDIICISERGEEEGIDVLNTSAQNAISLAVYITSARLGLHPLSILLLDDPTQTFDERHVRKLAEALEKISEDVQVVVATADERFQKALIELFYDKAYIYKFEKDWAPEEGPIFERLR